MNDLIAAFLKGVRRQTGIRVAMGFMSDQSDSIPEIQKKPKRKAA